MKILIVDDDRRLRQMLVEFMTERGWTAVQAANGREGLERALADIPDLILCDYDMGQMNGYDMLAALRENESTAAVPFILMTGATDEAQWRRTMDKGADDYIAKPFGLAQLATTIEARVSRLGEARRAAEKKLGALKRQVTLALPHELKTPLHGILGLTEPLKEDFDTMTRDEVLAMIDDIHMSGERLLRLILNYIGYLELVTVSSDPARRAAFAKGSVANASAPTSEAAQRVAKRWEREADLKLETKEGEPAMRGENLSRLVEELVDNAFKFSSSGNPVGVQAGIAGDRWVFSVTDKGRGMTPDQIRGIAAYVQFDREVHEQQGAGLGLTISRMLVELHEGTVRVESTPGTETRVTVSLPRAAPAAG
jgi:two-component system sensor histidine kinase/response regulator